MGSTAGNVAIPADRPAGHPCRRQGLAHFAGKRELPVGGLSDRAAGDRRRARICLVAASEGLARKELLGEQGVVA